MDHTKYAPSQEMLERINRDFSLQKCSEEQGNRCHGLREAARELAHSIVCDTPASREQSLALTALDEAIRWAIAAIVREKV
jgi:hypothetical protein